MNAKAGKKKKGRGVEKENERRRGAKKEKGEPVLINSTRRKEKAFALKVRHIK